MNEKGDQICKVCSKTSFATKKSNVFHGICPHCKFKGYLKPLSERECENVSKF